MKAKKVPVLVVSDASRAAEEPQEVADLSEERTEEAGTAEAEELHVVMLDNRAKETLLTVLMRAAEATVDHHADSSDATSVVSAFCAMFLLIF